MITLEAQIAQDMQEHMLDNGHTVFEIPSTEALAQAVRAALPGIEWKYDHKGTLKARRLSYWREV